MIRMSAKEYQEFLKQQGNSTKYRNKYVYIYQDGFIAHSRMAQGHGKVVERVDSVKEFQRGKELELLERAGKIQNLKKQVPLLIEEGFVGKDKKRHRATYYKADFMYEEMGETIVEDVKGIDLKTGKIRMTEAFRLKWKLLQAKYPDYVFRIY